MPADDAPRTGPETKEPAPAPEPEKTETQDSPAPEPEKTETAPPERPENEPTDKKEDPEEEHQTLQSAMNEQPEIERKSKRKAADEAEAKKKEEEEAAAAAEKEKETAEAEKPNTDDRDKDLKIEHGPNTHLNTRKKFDAIAAKTKAARDERDAAIAEREALRKERDEFKAKVESKEPPKELVEENKKLLEKVRELDIAQDPVLRKKYDEPAEANNERILNILRTHKYDKTKVTKSDGTEEFIDNPTAIPRLLKDGLTLKNLNPLIQALEKADLVEDAEDIREAIRANRRLADEKQVQIQSWKGDYSRRKQAQEQETKAQQEKRQADFIAHTDTQLKAEVDELSKNFSYLKRPAGPLPTDPPAVVAAKNKQIAEFEAAEKQVAEAVKGLNTSEAPPEKFAEVVGRINANAIQSIMLKTHVLPRVLKEMAAKDARIKELEARLSKIDNASRISRAQGAGPSTDNVNPTASQPRDMMEALLMHGPQGHG